MTWNGQDILRHPETVRRVLGYVPQDFGLYPQISVRVLLRYLGELKGLRGAQLRRQVEAVLEMVGLSADADRRLKTFSGGMVRRLGIAQALLNEPRLLVLDEPTVGLDPAERVRFRELLPSLSGERTVIFSTHIIGDIEATATHLALLNHGRLSWTGTPEALLADAAEALWTLIVSQAEFERVRARYRVSSAIPRGSNVETRILAAHQPHPQDSYPGRTGASREGRGFRFSQAGMRERGRGPGCRENASRNLFRALRRHWPYDEYFCDHPDYTGIEALNPVLDGRSGGLRAGALNVFGWL